jgi:hypothetical protein
MKEQIKSVSESRMSICKECSYYSENKKKDGHTFSRPDVHCTNCGCTLAAKTKCLSCECPLKKWMGVVKTQEEEQKLKNDLK